MTVYLPNDRAESLGLELNREADYVDAHTGAPLYTIPFNDPALQWRNGELVGMYAGRVREDWLRRNPRPREGRR